MKTKKFANKKKGYKKKGTLKMMRNAPDGSIRDAILKGSAGAKKLNMKKIVSIGTQKVVSRLQIMNQESVGEGRVYLDWRDPATNPSYNLPVHVYHLSGLDNGGINNPLACAAVQLGWSSILPTANVTAGVFGVYRPDGTFNPVSRFYDEINGVSLTTGNTSKALHLWTSIKMKIYGALAEDSRITISLMKFDEPANPFYTSLGNDEMKQMVENLARPYIYNSIGSSNTKSKLYYRTLKEWNIMIPRKEDADLIAPAETHNTRDVNLFIRHNELYKYDWPLPNTNTINSHDAQGAAGFGVDYFQHTYPTSNKMLFLVVRGTCAKFVTDLDKRSWAASYDIIVRRGMLVS